MKTYIIISTFKIFASFNWQETTERNAFQGPSTPTNGTGREAF